MSPSLSSVTRYGVDAAYVPAAFLVIGAVFVACAGASLVWLVIGIFFWAQAASFLYASLVGKHRAWARLLNQLNLNGDEHVVDLGCGRGAVLLAAAARLPQGHATGVDVWRSVDQSGNNEHTTATNATTAGVHDRISLDTADIRALPYPDNTFDVVLSSLAIHNLKGTAARRIAINEAYRVLAEGGRIVIADIRSINNYRDRLQQLGAATIATASLGPGCWFGGPWQATRIVSATKQSAT